MKKEKKQVSKLEKTPKAIEKKALKKKSKEGTKVLSARIDEDLLTEFDKEAKDKGISRSKLLFQRIKDASSESIASNEVVKNEDFEKALKESPWLQDLWEAEVKKKAYQQKQVVSDESDDLADKELEKLIDDTEEALKSGTSPSFVVSLPNSQGQKVNFIPPTPIADLAQVISLRLTNTTDEKLHNVKIFNFDFKQQYQIKYENLTGMAYSEFLRKWDKLESNKYNINKVRLVALCDYKKFERKQLSGKIFYKNTNVFSLSSAVPTEPMMWYSPFQEQPNIIDIERTFRILSDTEFELEYLMPDTTVDIHFFITKNPETQYGK